MNIENVNLGKRKTLVIFASALGAVGVGFATVPFIASWLPSARAKALGAPVKTSSTELFLLITKTG